MDVGNYNNGIYMDIYVLEGYYDSRFMWQLQNALLRMAIKPLNAYYRDCWKVKSTKVRILRSLCPLFRLFPYRFWVEVYKVILRMATKSAKRIGIRDEISEMAKRYWIYKSEMDDIVELDFEWLKVPIVRNYDKVLRRMYGDYMVFPPVDERGMWHEGVIHFEPDLPYKTYLASRQRDVSRGNA